MTNKEIAKIFEELAKLLEIKGENPFKIRAYLNASREINALPYSLESMVQEGKDLTKLPNIGEQIAKKIQEIVNTGKLEKLEKLKKEFPPALLNLLAIEGLGAKHIKTLYENLHFNTVEELQELAKEHKIQTLKGFGPKLEEKIAKGLKLLKQEGIRFLYAQAEPYANELYKYLQNAPTIIRLEIAGSFRRKKETVGDLDIVASASNPQKVIEFFTRFPKVSQIVSAGYTRSTIVLDNSLQVDFRVVKDEHFGSALHYFTGSKAHVLEIRRIAQDLNLKINEYGLFSNDKNLASKEEADIYRAFGMEYIEPELRENRGELEAAKNGTLPKLIELNDIKADIHIYSNFSLGKNSIEEIANYAQKLGYRYIAITDHFGSIDSNKIEQYLKEIERLNSKYKDFKILKGVECDILEDGSLALNSDTLSKFDIVYGVINSNFKLPKDKQSARLIKAIQNPYLSAISHISNRVIQQYEGIELNYKEIFNALKSNNKLLEINSQPNRLDINDILAKEAKKYGIKFLINSSAKSLEELHYIKYGVNQARRGWLEKSDVLNCLMEFKILPFISS